MLILRPIITTTRLLQVLDVFLVGKELPWHRLELRLVPLLRLGLEYGHGPMELGVSPHVVIGVFHCSLMHINSVDLHVLELQSLVLPLLELLVVVSRHHFINLLLLFDCGHRLKIFGVCSYLDSRYIS